MKAVIETVIGDVASAHRILESKIDQLVADGRMKERTLTSLSKQSEPYSSTVVEADEKRAEEVEVVSYHASRVLVLERELQAIRK